VTKGWINLPVQLSRGSQMADIRVVVIDDHPIFRAGVTHTLTAAPDVTVIGEGCSVSDALQLAGQNCPDVMVLDLNMPGGGIGAIGQLGERFPSVKPLILSGAADAEQVRAAMQEGAWGYVMKGVSATELVHSIRAIHRGERYVTPALAAKLFAALPAEPANLVTNSFPSLTAREEQILALIAEGLSNKEIGGRLELSEKTVKHYLTIVMDKLNVRTRVQAALLAHGRHGFVG
jgi:two-component system nitrate/nitrite response regulator NarL